MMEIRENIFAAFACPQDHKQEQEQEQEQLHDSKRTKVCRKDSLITIVSATAGVVDSQKQSSVQPLQQLVEDSAVIEMESNMKTISDIARANKEMHDSFMKTKVIEHTPDNKNKQIFANFKVACAHYNFPGSFQSGTVWNAEGVVRSYSNSTPGKDKVLNNGSEIWYRLKSTDMQANFERNIVSGQRVRFFRRVPPYVINKVTQKPGCKDMGLFRVAGFVEQDAFVRLVEEEGAEED